MRWFNLVLVASVLTAVGAVAVSTLLDGSRLLADSRNSGDRWYPNNWLEAPVTKAMLLFGKTREYTKLNANGSEVWRVRETQLGRRQFWTTLSRTPVERAKLPLAPRKELS